MKVLRVRFALGLLLITASRGAFSQVAVTGATTPPPSGAAAQAKENKQNVKHKLRNRAGHFIPPRERKALESERKRRAGIEAQHERILEAARAKARGAGVTKSSSVKRDVDFPGGVSGGQAEFAIAVDSTGKNVVVGFNTFATDPLNLSGMGVAYSNDGGATFHDAGFLPSPGSSSAPDGTALPQIVSDPDIKYVPGGNGCQFVAASIIEVRFPATGPVTSTAFTLGVHRSTDCGHTWTGPFEVTPATNPTGSTRRGAPVDSADKELMDVNPDTGRVLLTWSNFAAKTIEICATYSDDVMTAVTPTWSPRAVLASGNNVTGSFPRFAGAGSNDVYAAWEALDTVGGTIQFAVSHDAGNTWQPAAALTNASFATMDDVLGNDRTHEFPSVAVDSSNGPRRGAIYVVYSNNDSNDGADVAFQRSTDGGQSFSSVKFLNSRPGNDRAQWFPYVTADKDTGRVSVIFYDQSFQPTGDLTQVLMTFSDDGGDTWSKPVPLTQRPFHAGYGNDTASPNLGDYIGATAQGGTLYAVWAGAPNSVAFTDGQPDIGFTAPMLFFRSFSGAAQATVDLGAISVTGSAGDGFLHPGDSASVRIELFNPVTNASGSAVTGLNATLSTATPGVTVLQNQSVYADLAPLAKSGGANDFQIALGSNFVPGTPLEFALDIQTDAGPVRRLFTQYTGAPSGAVIFSEDFESVAEGGIPSGWTVAHGAGVNRVPWTTSKSFCGVTSNGLFHINAADGTASGDYRWERAFSPTFAVPANAQYVTVDFDVCYDTEDDPILPILAYDGFFLRFTDLTPGNTTRSVYADAFDTTMTTGDYLVYPKHLNDDRSANYFGDTSAWAGDSGGVVHVSMRLPGMAGTTVQMRWEFTQDQTATCTDVRPSHTQCGVWVDNIVVRSVASN